MSQSFVISQSPARGSPGAWQIEFLLGARSTSLVCTALALVVMCTMEENALRADSLVIPLVAACIGLQVRLLADPTAPPFAPMTIVTGIVASPPRAGSQSSDAV